MTFRGWHRTTSIPAVPEPVPHVTALSANDLHNIRRNTMESIHPSGPPVVVHTCDICGETVPQHAGHVCTLTKRQLRRLVEHQRREAAAEAQRHAPQPCGDCGVAMIPGRTHACSGPPADHALTQGLAWAQAQLRRALLGD